MDKTAGGEVNWTTVARYGAGGALGGAGIAALLGVGNAIRRMREEKAKAEAGTETDDSTIVLRLPSKTAFVGKPLNETPPEYITPGSQTDLAAAIPPTAGSTTYKAPSVKQPGVAKQPTAAGSITSAEYEAPNSDTIDKDAPVQRVTKGPITDKGQGRDVAGKYDDKLPGYTKKKRKPINIKLAGSDPDITRLAAWLAAIAGAAGGWQGTSYMLQKQREDELKDEVEKSKSEFMNKLRAPQQSTAMQKVSWSQKQEFIDVVEGRKQAAAIEHLLGCDQRNDTKHTVVGLSRSLLRHQPHHIQAFHAVGRENRNGIADRDFLILGIIPHQHNFICV